MRIDMCIDVCADIFISRVLGALERLLHLAWHMDRHVYRYALRAILHVVNVALFRGSSILNKSYAPSCFPYGLTNTAARGGPATETRET